MPSRTALMSSSLDFIYSPFLLYSKPFLKCVSAGSLDNDGYGKTDIRRKRSAVMVKAFLRYWIVGEGDFLNRITSFKMSFPRKRESRKFIVFSLTDLFFLLITGGPISVGRVLAPNFEFALSTFPEPCLLLGYENADAWVAGP